MFVVCMMRTFEEHLLPSGKKDNKLLLLLINEKDNWKQAVSLFLSLSFGEMFAESCETARRQ